MDRRPRRGRWIGAMSATAAVVVTGAALAVVSRTGGDGTPSVPVGTQVSITGLGSAVTESAAHVALETLRPDDPLSPAPRATATRRRPTAAPKPTLKPTDVPRPTARATAAPTAAPRRTLERRPSAPPSPVSSSQPTAQPPSPRPSPKPSRLVELGPGHFTDYCKSIGWEWVEYRESPQPGAYCVKNKDQATMYLTQSQRDAGCRWRFTNPNAFHRFKGKSNYCYVYR